VVLVAGPKGKMSFNPKLLHYGIFGPGLSGKTTLAMYLSREYWRVSQIKSLVHDPNRDTWGGQAWVTEQEELFWEMVWHRETNCALFIEEAAETIARDNAKTALFTRVRHRGHRLHVIGHSGSNLLPVQREQIHTLYLFKQTEAGAGLWAEQFADGRIMEAATLRQYEFLWCRLYQAPRRLRLRL
jgi:hypothetical protein